jgi:uncharacterized membrane protein
MKRFFLRGLAALLPTVLTLWILVALWGVLLDNVARPVTRAIHWTLTSNRAGKAVLETTTGLRLYDAQFVSEKVRQEVGPDLPRVLADAEKNSGFVLDLSLIDRQALERELSTRIPPAFGFVVGIVGVYFVGLLLGGYVGRLFWSLLEKLIHSIPFVKKIYPYAKQIVDFFFGEKSTKREFHAVVAVPYPHPGIYSIGFITGNGIKTLNDRANDEFVTVFMPSSPTPISGFTIFVPKHQVLPMNLSVDDTFRMMISGGVIVPPSERVVEGARASRPAQVPARP